MAEIPASFYYVVGILVVTNLGAIGGLIMLGAKAIWYTAKADTRIDDAKSMAIRAHKRIDKLEEESD